MKKILFILFSIFVLNSCAVFYGPNTEKLTQQLELGMSKQRVIEIMGTNYFVESAMQVPEGKLEILHFRSTEYPNYLLYFLNGDLTEFHRYIPPTPMHQDVRIVKEESK